MHPCLGFGCREEREQRRADIEHLASSLVNKVNECVGAIDEGEPDSSGAAVMLTNGMPFIVLCLAMAHRVAALPPALSLLEGTACFVHAAVLADRPYIS
jgi:hypothetical protein